MSYLGITDVFFVYPQVEAGIYALENQSGLGSLRVFFIVKGMAIGSRRVVIRNMGWIEGERIVDIGVLMLVVTMMLPGSRNRDTPG